MLVTRSGCGEAIFGTPPVNHPPAWTVDCKVQLSFCKVGRLCPIYVELRTIDRRWTMTSLPAGQGLLTVLGSRRLDLIRQRRGILRNLPFGGRESVQGPSNRFNAFAVGGQPSRHYPPEFPGPTVHRCLQTPLCCFSFQIVADSWRLTRPYHAAIPRSDQMMLEISGAVFVCGWRSDQGSTAGFRIGQNRLTFPGGDLIIGFREPGPKALPGSAVSSLRWSSAAPAVATR